MGYMIVRDQRAFTLVELLMVTAVLGVLALITLPRFNDYVTKTKNTRCTAEIRAIDQAIAAYVIEKNALPATLLTAGFSQADPWQRPYIYSIIGGGAAPLENFLGDPLNTDYDLYSTGPDGASGASAALAVSADDIVRANDGVFAGAREGL